MCKRSLPRAEFFKNYATNDGLGSQCKTCDKIGRVQRSREKKKILVDLLGGKCNECGYNKCIQALEFHHHDDNKEFTIGYLLKCNLEKLKKEALKCTLLCSNCHREHHYDEELGKDLPGSIRRRKGDVVHGTAYGYKKCGPPKCEKCKEALSTYRNNLYSRNKNKSS